MSTRPEFKAGFSVVHGTDMRPTAHDLHQAEFPAIPR